MKPTTVTAPTISQTEKELTRSLLLLAGDVERNPGPENSLLSVLSWNCRSISQKGSYIQRLLSHYSPDVLCLQETWSKEHISHPGYYTYRKDRNTKGGGIIIMAKRCFSQGISDEELFSRTSGIEAMMLNVGGVNVINVYAPPGCIIREDDLPITTKSIIAGDFNAHNLVWSTRTTKSGKELFNWADRNDVLVANRPGQITRPKHDIPGGGTSPDVIFFKGSIVLEEFSIINEDSKHNSDHRPLLAIFDTMAHLSQATVGARKRTVWDFKSTNWSAFRQQLDRRIDRAKFSDDATGNVGLLNNIIHEVAARNVRRRILFKGKRRRKWKISSPESLKSKGSHLKDQLRKGNNFNFAFKKIKELQQDAGKDISVSNISENDLPAAFLDLFVADGDAAKLEAPSLEKEDLELDICCDFTDTEISAAIKNLKPRKAAGPDGIHNEMLKNLSQKAVDCLLKVINSSWRSSNVPYLWKQGLIKPMFKSGKPRNDIKSYRPITLTSVVGKLAERLVYDRLMHWLTENSALSPIQAGFRRGRNTCEQITILVDAMVNNHTKGRRSVFLSFDFTAAFDRINHRILLSKLQRMGIPTFIVRWITDFLTNRKVRVDANGHFSKFRTLSKGVPQGSILGPLLYLIYVDDLCKILSQEKETTLTALYADDTACAVFGSTMDEAISNAQRILDIVDKWCRDNDMALSVSKTCALKMDIQSKEVTLTDTSDRELLFSKSLEVRSLDIDYFDLDSVINTTTTRPTLLSGETILEVEGKPIRTQQELEDLLMLNIHDEMNVKAKIKIAFLLPITDSVKYLGVYIDNRLRFDKQLEKIHDELKKGISLLQCLQPYELDYKTLKMVKNLYVTARISYALDSFGWLLNQHKTDAIDFEMRKIARLVTGCSRCTPRELLLWEADILPFKRQIEKQTKIAYFRYKAMTWVPDTNSLASPRSFWGGLIPRSEGQLESVGIVQPDSIKPWIASDNVQISNSCGFTKSPDPAVDREKFLTYNATLPPVDMVINCDGSYSSNASGAALIARSRDGKKRAHATRLVRADCSYRTEQHALKNAANYLNWKVQKDGLTKSVRIYTDSKSLLDELKGGRCKQRNTRSLGILENLRNCGMKVHLQFIPSHMGIEAHDEVDELAKKSAHNRYLSQIPIRGSFFYHKSRVRRGITKDIWNRIGYTCYKNTVKGAAIKYPPDMKRSDEIRIANFRTGCHPLMQNWRKAIICPFCHSAPSNQLHLLVGCPSQKLDAARYEILGFSTLTGKWDRSSDLILINGIPASLGSIFATSWLPSVAMLIRWMEQASNLRLWNCVGDT